MNFNPAFLKIYTDRQLDQLSKAGSNVDNGSSKTSQEVHLTPGISRNIFSSLFRREQQEPPETNTTSNDTNVELNITDLDKSPRDVNFEFQPADQPVNNEESQNSVGVDWEKHQEELDDTRLISDAVSLNANCDGDNSRVLSPPLSAQAGAEDPAEPENYQLQKESNKHVMLSPCHCTRMKCYKKFTDDERKNIWRKFWTGNYCARKKFIVLNMTQKSVERHCGKGIRKMKTSSWCYQLMGKTVCKLMFLRTLGKSIFKSKV